MNANETPLSLPLLFNERQHERCRLEQVEPITNTTSFLKTCFNGLNVLAGVGILSMPYALASGGWLSLILLFVIAAAACYSGLLIQRCMDEDSNIKTYPDLGEVAFGKKGRMVMSIFMNIELYLVATAFLILEGDNLHNLFPNLKLQVAAGFTIGGKQCFIIIAGLVVLPTVLLDNQSLLSYVSASGVFASAVILGSILWAGVFDGVGFHHEGSVLLDWSGIPTALSLYVFCYCAHPRVPYPVHIDEKQTSVPTCPPCVLYLEHHWLCINGSFRVLNVWVNSSITNNFKPPNSKSQLKSCKWTTLVNPLSKYALMVSPIVNTAKNWFPSQYKKSQPLGLVVSTTLVISSIIVALALPFFAYLMALVGAFLSVTASIIFPCFCYLKISGAYRKLIGCEPLIIGFLILMGATFVILGTYTSLVQIIKAFVT